VLIVDDTPANPAFLSDALDDEGYEVLVAPSGLSALRQLELVRPDIILLDALMPELDASIPASDSRPIAIRRTSP